MACQVQLRTASHTSSLAVKTRDTQNAKKCCASLAAASKNISFLASSQADTRHFGGKVAAGRRAARGPVSVRADVLVKDGETLAGLVRV